MKIELIYISRRLTPKIVVLSFTDKTGNGAFIAPDAKDWVLLLQKPQDSKQANMKGKE